MLTKAYQYHFHSTNLPGYLYENKIISLAFSNVDILDLTVSYKLYTYINLLILSHKYAGRLVCKKYLNRKNILICLYKDFTRILATPLAALK